MTERTPEERLREANSGTWNLPTFKIEFAKKVQNPLDKENTLHKLLEQYTNRVHPRREFFAVSVEEVRTFFDLMDGEMWTAPAPALEQVGGEEEVVQPPSKVPRDMSKVFKDGQQIRHVFGVNQTWVGTYAAASNSILCDGQTYTSLSAFALQHLRTRNPMRQAVNGWSECEVLVNGVWVIADSVVTASGDIRA